MTEGDYNGKELLLFQLGPVQESIAQARSTRDLWSGSYLLSWLVGDLRLLFSDLGTGILDAVLVHGPGR